jgi:hypothetical protein
MKEPVYLKDIMRMLEAGSLKVFKSLALAAWN